MSPSERKARFAKLLVAAAGPSTPLSIPEKNPITVFTDTDEIWIDGRGEYVYHFDWYIRKTWCINVSGLHFYEKVSTVLDWLRT